MAQGLIERNHSQIVALIDRSDNDTVAQHVEHVMQIFKRQSQNSSDLQCIGVGLGAQICSMIGKKLVQESEEFLGKITGEV